VLTMLRQMKKKSLIFNSRPECASTLKFGASSRVEKASLVK
jgi:hypothetical protein